MAEARVGDYRLTQLSITNFDGTDTRSLLETRQRLEIYEDIFASTMHGYITFTSSTGFAERFPVRGEETIKFYLEQPRVKLPDGSSREFEPMELEFRVVAIVNRELIRDRNEILTLAFVSKENIINQRTRVRKTFTGQPNSDVVNTIFKNHLASTKPIIIHPSKGIQSVTIPNLNPLAAIDWLAARSVPLGKKGSDYLFFETHTGFNFVSLQQLIETQPRVKREFTYIPPNQTSFPTQDVLAYADNIESYKIASTADVSRAQKSGMYASRLHTYDFVTGVFTTHDFDMKDHFDEIVTLDANLPFTPGIDTAAGYESVIAFQPTAKSQATVDYIKSRETANPNLVEEWLLQRQGRINLLQGVKMEIKVPGNTEIKPGDVVGLHIPSMIYQKPQDELRTYDEDKYYSGRYLVSAAHHVVTKERYYMELELLKDSLSSPIEREE